MNGIDRVNRRAAEVAARTWDPKYALVDVVAAEVPERSERYARRQALRDLLWGLVEAGAYANFDEALAAYAEGRLTGEVV